MKWLRRRRRPVPPPAPPRAPGHAPPPIVLDITVNPDNSVTAAPDVMDQLRGASHVHDLLGRCVKIRGAGAYCKPQPAVPPLDDREALLRWLDDE